MKKALIILGTFLALSLIGCGDKDQKALETSAPPTDPNATTYENGGKPKDAPAAEPGNAGGPQGPMMKPEGM